ncbi:MAG: NAD(+) diphosphatase [Desulfuromonadales bacterium]|nr:NAD(+) diphosphatase [Desulfuromonadales bacterium]
MRDIEPSCLPFSSCMMGDNFVAVRQGEADNGEPGIWIVFRGDALVLNSGEGNAFIEGMLPEWAATLDSRILIGTWKGRPVRILELGADSQVPQEYLVEPLLQIFLRYVLPDHFLTLAGLAQQILEWERKSRICSRCGSLMNEIAGSWGKRCRECGAEHFPHIHPCTLVLVSRGDELLLVRKAEWPAGYYSIPSGFCDFGESLEECARREVKEETGILIRNLRYVGSQSWPFPAQLMAGYTADYAGGELSIDLDELEDAAWFRRDALPPTFSDKSIAGWMLVTFGKIPPDQP